MVTKQKILIVDDDENIAELISLYLTKECFDTRIVHDGESALQAHKSFQPDMILLDIMLPRMDGYQVCRELRTYSNTPIIMLSAICFFLFFEKLNNIFMWNYIFHVTIIVL